MEDLLHAVKPYTTVQFIKKRTVLFYQGEIPRQAKIIRSGVVKVYSITATGEERIVSLYSTGDVFPLPWIFNETSNTLFYFEAITNCEIISLPKNDLLETLANNLTLQNSVLKSVVSEYTALLLHVTALEQSRAAEKIGFTLYYLMFRHSKKITDDTYLITLKLTQPMLASLVGLTSESIVINLRMLKRKGIVTFHHFAYEINKPKLEKFLGEDSFRDLMIH